VSSHAAKIPTAEQIQKLPPFTGGKGAMAAAGGIGAVLLLATVVAALTGDEVTAKEAYYSYVVAFAYWAGLGFAATILLQALHATRARWVTVLRRPIEVMAATMPLFLLLFIPIAVGMKEIFQWVDPEHWGGPQIVAELSKEALERIHHKAPWLNVGFFVARGFIYVAIAAFVSERLFRMSLRLDSGKEDNWSLLARMRRLASGGLPFVGLAMTFAAFDWMMSLNPTWFSTIFGVYYFAGSFGAALSVLAVVTWQAGLKNVLGGGMNVEHTHSVGKLMLAFTAFWTYIAFSQLLLIWIAGLPEEIPFYITRFNPGWRGIGIFLIFGHFFLPFGALLSRSLKRTPKQLAAVAVWILLVNFIDIYWLVMPKLHPEGVSFHWSTLTAFVGMGLVAIAFALFRFRGRLPVPVRDPYISESLRYRQP
jgi:hypothetical protein